MSTSSTRAAKQVASMYRALSKAWGPQHWWPAQSRFEVIVGAFLTQNTSWNNVEIAMGNLRKAKVLSVDGIRGIPIAELEQLVRSSGYFRQKAARLKNFVAFLDKEYGGSLSRMFTQPTLSLRQQLLALNGVGPETADSILLYAGQHEIFVVDAYTRRLATRHGVVSEQATYDELRQLFERGLALAAGNKHEAAQEAMHVPAHPPSRMSRTARSSTAEIFNEMHGLIVGVGKKHCFKSQPDCDQCPLKHLLLGAKVAYAQEL